MPDFTVRVQKTLQFEADIIVTADDEDAAAEEAEKICNDLERLVRHRVEWELEDEEYEVLEVTEN